MLNKVISVITDNLSAVKSVPGVLKLGYSGKVYLITIFQWLLVTIYGQTFRHKRIKSQKMEQNTKFSKNQKRRLAKREKAIRTALYAYFKYYEQNRWMRSVTILLDDNFKHCMSVLAKREFESCYFDKYAVFSAAEQLAKAGLLEMSKPHVRRLDHGVIVRDTKFKLST